MPDYTIPRPNEPLLDQDGTPSLRWYNFWRTRLAGSSEEELQAEIETIARKLGSPDGSVEGIPDFDLDGFLSAATKIIGIQSVTVVGTLANGTVFLQLDGDQSSPPAGYYYGADGGGTRGWWAQTGSGIDLSGTYIWAPESIAPTWGQFSAGAEPDPELATEILFNRLDVTGQAHDGILALLTENAVIYWQAQEDVTAWARYRVTGVATQTDDVVSVPVEFLEGGSTPLVAEQRTNALIFPAVDPALIDHNELDNLQGGSPTERYHLTSAEAASVPTAIQEVVAGTGISVDVTDPIRPIVSTTGSGAVNSVTAQYSIENVGTAADPILQLENDLASPAAMTTYSVDGSGTRGWHRPALFESTGVIDGCALSIGAPNTTFSIAAGTLGFTDWSITPVQPTRIVLPFAGATNVPVTGIGASVVTYVGINSSGTVIQQSSPFTNAQSRSIAVVGAVVHSNLSTVNAVNNQPIVIRSGINQVADFMQAVGALNLSGNVYSANGANLQINKSAGAIFKMGSNFQTSANDPHVTTLPAQTALTFRYRTSTGVETADTTSILPNVYESAPGVLTAVPVLINTWHVQRINIFQSGLTRIQYGQSVYPSQAAAVAAIGTDPFTTEPNIADNAILRCYLIINRGILSLLGSTQFSNVSKFGAIASGGSAVTAAAITSALGYTPLADAPSDGTSYGRLNGAWAGVQPLDADLTAIAALASTGFAVRTAANTWAQRSFPNGTGYTWTNPAGVAGDPTLVLSANLQSWSGISDSTVVKNNTSSEAILSNGIRFAVSSGINYIQSGNGTGTAGQFSELRIGPWQSSMWSMRFLSSGAAEVADGLRVLGNNAMKLDGSSSDHAYMEFYANAGSPSTRSAYFGFAAAGDRNFILNNQFSGGSISMSPGTGGEVIALSSLQARGVTYPNNDNTYDLGKPSQRWAVVRAGTGSINTSDAREKTEPRDLTESEIACSIELGRLRCVYQWLARIEERGEAARLHCGPTVQAVIACMESHGIDPFRWGFVCYDEWPETPEERDEDGEVTQAYQPAGDRYSLRPSELAWFVIRGQAARQDALEARIAALESLV